MVRKISDERFCDLIETATEVFIAQGYRRTKMADIAEAIGVAKGTVYLYVESKEALFDAVIRYADAEFPIHVPAELPIPTPKQGATLAFVQKALAQARSLPGLNGALTRRRVADFRHELEEIIRELYLTVSRSRTGLKLIDSRAPEQPELAELWFKGGRGYLLTLLTRYLESRRTQLTSMPDTAIAARIVIETIVFWAVHRYWDPSPQVVDDRAAEETVVQFILNALVKR